MTGQGVPLAARERRTRVTQPQERTTVALQEQMRADHVLHRSRLAPTGVAPWHGQRPHGVLGVMGLDHLMSPRAHHQLLHGGDVEPGEHDPFGDGQVMCGTLPTGRVDTDVPLGDVRAVGTYGRVRGDVGEDEPRLFEDLAGDRRVQGLARLGPATDQGPGTGVADRFVRIPQMQEILAAAVADQYSGTCVRSGSGRAQGNLLGRGCSLYVSGPAARLSRCE